MQPKDNYLLLLTDSARSVKTTEIAAGLAFLRVCSRATSTECLQLLRFNVPSNIMATTERCYRLLNIVCVH